MNLWNQLFLFFFSTLIIFSNVHGTDDPCIHYKQNCTCTAFEDEKFFIKIDCYKKGYISLPTADTLPNNVAAINMKLNSIQTLSQLEKNDALTHLELTLNNLEKLDNFAFEHTPKIIQIDLSFNQLAEIPETVFDALDDLQFLNLSNNRLRTLPKKLFYNNHMLAELNIASNPLKYISGEQFLYLTKLYSLKMSKNEIFSLSSEIFHNLHSLTDLDLSQNEFQSVPTNALRLIKQLRLLDISENPITVLDENSFKGLKTIRHLSINQMKHLYVIKQKTFSEMTLLEELFIVDNHVLSYIDEKAFLGMFNKTWFPLKAVSFRKNHLAYLSKKMLPFCNLTFLELQENPWFCDCNLRWIRECDNRLEFEKDLICANPKSYLGHSLSDISSENLICKSIENIHMHHAFILTATVLLLLSIFILYHTKRITSYFTNRNNTGPIYYVRANGGEF